MSRRFWLGPKEKRAYIATLRESGTRRPVASIRVEACTLLDAKGAAATAFNNTHPQAGGYFITAKLA